MGVTMSKIAVAYGICSYVVVIAFVFLVCLFEYVVGAYPDHQAHVRTVARGEQFRGLRGRGLECTFLRHFEIFRPPSRSPQVRLVPLNVRRN